MKNVECDKDKLSLLWECCQIPDFVKKNYGNHYEVISSVFKYINREKEQTNRRLNQIKISQKVVR